MYWSSQHKQLNKEFLVSLSWDINTTSSNNCIKLYSHHQQCMTSILTFYPAVISSSFNPIAFIENLGRCLPLTRSEKLNCSHNLLSSKTTRQMHTYLPNDSDRADKKGEHSVCQEQINDVSGAWLHLASELPNISLVTGRKSRILLQMDQASYLTLQN